jgi:two-component system, OmpR family, response regulator
MRRQAEGTTMMLPILAIGHERKFRVGGRSTLTTNMKPPHQNPQGVTVLKVWDLKMDLVAHTVKRGRTKIVLNRKEFALLEYLMRNPGKLLTRQMILEHVWDMNADPFTNTVDVHIRFLRAKIDDPWKKKLLKSVYGYGYKLEA